MKIHFIGIGGIGISALTQYYLEKGDTVSGSDLATSETIETLKKKGAKISIGKHDPKNLPKDTDIVIYSPAVQPTNPELKEAQVANLQILSYPQALGRLSKQYFTIAVSGTHGKSTVVAMVSLILIKAGFNPTVILGTKLKEFGNTNFRMGKSKYLVIEADEWQASFLKYWPKIIVLTNIEKEHLDYYKNLNHILKTYKIYLSHLSEDGFLIASKDNKNIKTLIQKILTDANYPIIRNIVYFSKEQEETRKLKEILKIPGEHNISNAQASLKVARILEIPDRISFQALSEYQGAWRRFELSSVKLGVTQDKITIISDYGHHPTEISATLEAAKEKFKDKKIFLVFQPHQHQRTFYLFNDFVRTLKKALERVHGKHPQRVQGKHPQQVQGKHSQQVQGKHLEQVQGKHLVDKIIITDIFDVPGRENEKIKKNVNSKKLVKAIDNPQTIYLAKDKIIDYLKKNLKGGEVVIIMGAGDIYKLAEELSTSAVD